MHLANHPQTKHYVCDVFEVDPVEVVDGRPVGLLWASPDCKHFSKAKGGKPVSKKIRGLAWVVIKWAKLVRPRIIFLENVEEFQTWGPLDADNMPCKLRKGRTFLRWKKSLENLGYVVSYQEYRACDLGTPTIRKRLFLVARCDGLPIVVPEQTHFPAGSIEVTKRKAKAYRTAADCIQWDQPAPSIFERTRELADATKRRIAKGIMRYVVDSANPFIVPLTHQGGDRTEDINKPMHTVTGANRGEKALIVPTLVQTGYGEREGQAPRALDLHKPLGTVVDGGKHALVTAFLTEHANASTQRVMAANEPLRTQMGEVKGGNFSVVAASLQKHYTGVVGSDMEDPMGTVTSVDHHSLLTAVLVNTANSKTTGRGPNTWQTEAPLRTVTSSDGQALVSAHLTKFRSGSVGSDMAEPVHTITAGGDPVRPSTGNVMGMVTANLVHMGHGEGKDGTKRFSHGIRDVELPLNTIAASGMPAGVVTSHMLKLRGDNVGSATNEPLHTISAGGTHHAEVRAFLVKYYGNEKEGVSVQEPLHTIPTHDRFGLVMVKGQPYAIVDIGLRMLKPRELYRAQGFADSYIIDWGIHPHTGEKIKMTTTASIRMCGNSVCPPMARAYVAANYQERLPMLEAA